MFLYVGWFVWVFELLILDDCGCGCEKKRMTRIFLLAVNENDNPDQVLTDYMYLTSF